MIKVFSAVILLLLLIPADLSFAQSQGGSKIYSGYLYKHSVKKGSFWHALFTGKSSPQNIVDHDMQCSVEFKIPIPFSHQSVVVVPGKLSYFIRFNNGGRVSADDSQKEKDAFEKFTIKIYTNDEDEYTIDPDAEGKQVGINEEHHIFDLYLIYLILGPDINHLEIVSTSGSGDNQDKYVLDKLEVHEDH